MARAHWSRPWKQGSWKKGKAILLFCLLSLFFGVAYTQDAVYHSPENQNTKYLQGLAQAGHGFLREDWTANTIDPLPAFSLLIRLTYSLIHTEYAFYFYYFLLFGLYVYSLIGIVRTAYPKIASRNRFLIFFALFLVVHCLHLKLFGIDFDLGWDLHAGVARQYILGPVFQPANFGVFLLFSILLFLKERPLWAASCLALAVTFHPAYFPSVAVLTAIYMLLLVSQGKVLQSLKTGVVSGSLSLPVLLYMLLGLGGTTPELSQQATDIIVNQRIPHHSWPAEWLGVNVYVQVGVVAIATFLSLSRSRKLAAILGGSFSVALGLTLLQVATANHFLAFVAPWRISVFLVPMSTCLILGAIVTGLSQSFPMTFQKRWVGQVGLFLILTAVVWGGIYQWNKWTVRDKAVPMMEFAKANRQSGQVYLLPPRSRRLRKFRLFTGVPIYINHKTHPYQDVEVIEWFERLTLADNFYNINASSDPTPAASQCQQLREKLIPAGITHVVLPAESTAERCPQLVELYQDEVYGIYSTEELSQ